MAELRVINSGKKSSALQDAAALTTQLVAGLEKIGLAMKSRTWRREGRAGLGPLQRQVLTLLRSKPGQCAQVSTVANELSVRLPTASEVIATLERKQLLRRRRDMSDGRVVMAQLTAKGNRSCAPSSRMPDRLATAAEALSAPEQVVLLTSLVKVIRSLQEQGEISVARMCVSCRYFRPNQHDNADRPHHCDYINAPFGDRSLRLDCHEYEPASTVQVNEAWANFTGSRTA
ncbi:MAG: MarR family transcriptional regulator [Nitrospirae bacterium]|nr:MarR family transcriptional regulator [Nitrospirota bacterium]MBU6482242.1 MarR family transcriptional regulator [Nitrospirota bacterium]MDE3221694.1 MarR family transcriptional regulator [Nitrospirota bacterium]